MNSAAISPCGRYRYRLDRDVQPEGKVFAFFGINPSTADASTDDATVRKWRGFSLRNGCQRFIVGNVFSYRATDVRQLDIANRAHTQVQGEEHWRHIHGIILEADVLVPCWGDSKKVDHNLRPLVDELLAIIALSGKPVLHFGRTANGDPRHPLMLSYSTPLIPWFQL